MIFLRGLRGRRTHKRSVSLDRRIARMIVYGYVLICFGIVWTPIGLYRMDLTQLVVGLACLLVAVYGLRQNRRAKRTLTDLRRSESARAYARGVRNGDH